MSTLQLDPPIFGTHKTSGMPIAILAMDWQGASCSMLYVDDDGYLHRDDPESLRSDWRYDTSEEEWYDAVERAKAELAEAAGESQDG